METQVYNQTGKSVGKVTLPESVFGVRWNADLVKQVADSLLSSKRKPVAHTKNRGEVRGGGKKPWQQKGTGRARHGSIRSPIWVGGGVTHGPRKEKNFERTVTKNMRAKALHTLLSQKYREGEVLFVDSIALTEPKTKIAIGTLNSLSGIKGFEYIFSKKNNAVAIALSTKNKETERAFQNLGNVEVVEARLRGPRITEKAALGADKSNVYVFEVAKGATKKSIADSVHQSYKVRPVKVRVAGIPARKVFVRGKMGVKKGGRKAYVYLKKGDKIEVI
ncbi:MAG: 50S ribosomal protein L4 [Parcubacteria group bacterium GW2011_GWA2_50_10b]|nr:MAG: 50S ribosomal protein L4 [Parcubacteria group bacterium GW2011_GWA2_50_10b]